LNRRVNVPFVAHRPVGNAAGVAKALLDRVAELLKRVGWTVADALDAARRREGNER